MQLLVILQSFPRLLPPAPLAGSLVATMRPWMDHSLLTIDQVDHRLDRPLAAILSCFSLFLSLSLPEQSEYKQNTSRREQGELFFLWLVRLPRLL
jgi:hypothetical protein